MPPQDILITGTGALALLLGSALGRAGHRVTLLGTWQAGIDIRVGEETLAVTATNNPADCAGAKLALVLVKSWQTARVARQLKECLSSDGVALTLQNGYGNRETLAAELGAERVALGSTTTGATLLGPGQVRPGGSGKMTIESHPRAAGAIALLRGAGFLVEAIENGDGLIWSKLVINAAINPLTALLRIPNGELLKTQSARSLMGSLATEAAAVAEAQGIPLNFSDPIAAAEDVAHRTAANHSSMYQDVMRGAPTEIDAICGAIVKVGQDVGVQTPVNEIMWRLVKSLKVAGRNSGADL
jgi:2-dehydropantoate 2-reductase